MSVKSWDSPGFWTTNYSAIAYSDDNGQTWTVDPSTIRSAASGRTSVAYVPGNQNFQQGAFVNGVKLDANGQPVSDGYLYSLGTPSGRGGAAYLSRVPQNAVQDLTKYQYWNGSTWFANTPSAATPILPRTTTTTSNDPFSWLRNVLVGSFGGVFDGFFNGFFGWLDSLFGSTTTTTHPTVGEMSAQYNTYLNKYVLMYADQNNNVVMRTADAPQGPWSAPTTLVTSTQYPGLYAPMMDPLSTGKDIYWNMSLWGNYNVELMHTTLP